MSAGFSDALRKVKVQASLLASGIVLIAVFSWLIPSSAVEAHNILHHLNFIPLIFSGMLLGWRGALLATAFAFLVHLPHFRYTWGSMTFDTTDQMVELSIFGAAGVITGLVADRERSQRTKAEKSSTELAKVYHELQQNIEEMRKAERLYAAGQLSASLAHEIRNPLISIAGAAGILKRGHASQANIEECLEIIDKESHRLSKLLTSFLDFARPRTPRFQWTDLTTVVQSVILLATHSSATGTVSVQQTLSGEIPEVRCDPEQIKQVLLNIILNAVQASAPGGSVSVSLVREANRILISVKDQGCGISGEHLSHIFEPFFTTKEQGTGLGLAVAAMIMRQHDGSIAALNNNGPGMTFQIELPLKSEGRL